jgi:fatty acid desaturase
MPLTETTTPTDRQPIPAQPYKRGYTAPTQMRAFIADAHRTRLWLTTATAAVDCLSVAALALAATWAVQALPIAAAASLCALCAAVIGRQLRALECLVHEASHFNWSRNHRRVNDILGSLLAGAPTGAKVETYRTSHLLHHGRFGTVDDPDLARYRQLDVEGMRRTSVRSFAWDVLIRLPRYQLGWVQTIKSSPLICAAPFVWCAAIITVPAFFAFGSQGAIEASAIWLAAYLLALPVIRFVGEASEHIYSTTRTVFDATISNLGFLQRYVIHPHNDGYHTIHHMWPGVPHHQLRRLHKQLTIVDEANYGKRLRYRTRVIQQPEAVL